MPGLARRFACVVSLFLVAELTCPVSRAQEQTLRTVLAIYSGAEDFPSNLVLDQAIREALTSADVPINYFAEYLESDQFGTADAAPALRDYIHRKYRGRRIDVALAITAESLQFVMDHRHELFHDAPVVFMGLPDPGGSSHRPDRNVATLLVGVAYAATLKVALTLHPSTERVYIVAHARYKPSENVVRSELGGFAGPVQLTYLNEDTVPRLLAAVRAVPPRSLILFIWHFQAEPGNVMYPDRVARLVAEAATVPVYGTNDFYMGSGVVGGMMRGTRETGTRVGEMARRILEGTPPGDIPIEQAPLVPAFDWRQLQRWEIDPSLLPAGSKILFRVLTPWETYRAYIVAAVVLFSVQLLLIVGLVRQHARWRRAEDAIRHSETTLRESYERIRHLAGRLISAQEATRTDIARDLHDDVCQDLVGVSMAIDSLKRGSAHVQDVETQHALADLQRWTLAIVEGVRRLSHELHPSSLQLLGLSSAMKAHCVEVEKRHDVQVSLKSQGDLNDLPADVALCLFRVGQEALRNAAVHGDARRIAVALVRTGEQVELRVTDDGRGFDLEAVRRSGSGLGLVSMEERAHAVGGSVLIATQPGRGTTLSIQVPARGGMEGSIPDTHIRMGEDARARTPAVRR